MPESNVNEILSENLRYWMDKRGVKQADVAEALGISEAAVSFWLSGKKYPTMGKIQKLADYLDVRTSDLIEYSRRPGKKSDSDSDKKEGTGRDFKKSDKLDGVCYDIRGPVLDEADRMDANGINVIKLNIGNPAPFHFYAPDEVIDDMIHCLRDSEGYSTSKGLFSARKAIMQYCQLKHFPNVKVNDIYTGNGASECITMSMQALLNNGDEVLVPMPDYPLWTASIKLSGGEPVHYRCDEQSNWYPDIDDMRRKITDKTVGIVVINPNNPTGALYPKEVLEQIADLAREFDLIVFADEIYDRLVFDGKEHVSIASLMPDRLCVTFNGLSKSHKVAGFRVGWMVLSGDKRHAKGYIEGLNLLSSMRLCSNVPGQQIIQTALGGIQTGDELLKPGGRLYEQREFIYNALNDIPGISTTKPDAAFYIFPKIDTKKIPILDDELMALDLLKDKHILLLQGTAMNWDEPDHFRIVYLPHRRTLQKALDGMTDFFSYYSQV